MYIGTNGISFTFDDGFYPSDVKDSRLSYYCTKFDTVCLRSPKSDGYENWLDQTRKNPRFRFVVAAPRILTGCRNKKAIETMWRIFWMGLDGRSGCKILKKSGKLGCVLLEFPTSLTCSLTSLKRLHYFLSIMPKDISIALEFKNASWWTKDALEELDPIFNQYVLNRGLTMVFTCLENRIVDSGWAGSMFSTNFVSHRGFKYNALGNFSVIRLYGSLGDCSGSYDEGHIMEHIADFMDEVRGPVFCIFNNTDSTYCKPLPPIMFEDSVFWPELKDLPCYVDVDLPACLHDALRLKEARKHKDVSLDSEGFRKVNFPRSILV